MTGENEETRPPLFAIKGDASPEEIAALVAVLQGIAASTAPPAPRRRSQWASPARAVRSTLLSGPGGWRSSALPR
ncbi:acyl-CoA carboxylase subunit epsilon [Nocardioides iriomotensis]|uniref:Acyl-CoA carboxylase subunit epsilon n=1 Tax=Nocardioides iriomotensis TaxID=715784 RepID=A0A4V1Z213_9ACTN|nr:acyl-CoA carboxylase subunit epsilon [Nocardioides iriomotensis]RYU12806.1 acyl-CoA carboxylase subunit epsilon [Nocardioides iriomotensis]